MALVLLIGLMSIFLTSTCGLNLTSPSSEYQAALGHDISLGCHFTLASEDVGPLEIEWTVNRSDDQEAGDHLICYIENVINHFQGFGGRVHFSSPEPQDGNASLTIKHVKITDKGTYQCTVKKFLEVQSRQIKLMVMDQVSVPVHGFSGGTESDVDLKLRNRSSLVTTIPPHYSLLTSNETSASTQDDLSSQDNESTSTGTYHHTHQAHTILVMTSGFNQVFGIANATAETSTVDLSLTKECQNTSSQDGGVSIGVSATITSIIIILAGTIFCCWKQKRQQKSDEENVSADEMRLEDTQPERTMIVDIIEDTWNLWENMGMELVDITKTLTDVKGEDSTEEVPETQNVDYEGRTPDTKCEKLVLSPEKGIC